MSTNLRSSLDRQITEAKARESAEGELRVAREMQESLLPRVPTADAFERYGVQLHAVNIPARAVAGDFYDHFIDARGRLVVCIADVSGKGARAAILMAVARTALRTAADAVEGPGELLGAVNQVLLNDTHTLNGSFVTMQVLCFGSDGRVTYANAGHPHVTALTAEGPPQSIAPTTGMIVGVLDDPSLNAATASLDLPADWTHLVLVTDGVLEAARPGEGGHRNMFDQAGLHSALTATDPPSPTLPADQVTAAVVDAVVAYEGEQRSDDLTVVTIKRLNPA
jgi:sigma-B regulation protein RsbU (phosphoserine phosphatase)